MGPGIGKILIITGMILGLIGLYLQLGGKLPPLGRLPGDIHIERNNFSIYIPLGTCLVISVLLSLIFWLLKK